MVLMSDEHAVQLLLLRPISTVGCVSESLGRLNFNYHRERLLIGPQAFC